MKEQIIDILYKVIRCIILIILISSFSLLAYILYPLITGNREPEFKIKTTGNIPANAIVNIEIYPAHDEKCNIQTLLYKNKTYSPSFKRADYYIFYVSKGNETFTIKLENVFANMNSSLDRINDIVLYEQDGKIFIDYYTLKSQKKRERKTKKPVSFSSKPSNTVDTEKFYNLYLCN